MSDNLPYRKLLAAFDKATSKNAKHFRESALEVGHIYEGFADGTVKDITDEVPFEIPESWEWVRLSEISYHVGSKDNQILSKQVKPDGKFPVVSQGQNIIDGYSNETQKVIYDLPLVMFGDHTRNVKYIDFPFVIGADGTKFHKVIGCDPKYIYFWMQYAATQLRNRGYARHYTLLAPMFIPVPPLSEQERICSKLNESIEIIQKYDLAETSRKVLDESLPDLLKKSILQQAVMGKLVPQDPNDEPASVLLEKIRAEKDALINAGKLKKDKHESIIYRRDNSHYEKLDGMERCIDDEIPFEIPASWLWIRLKSLGITQTGNTPSKLHPEYFGNDIPFIGPGDIQNSDIDYQNQGLSLSGKANGRIVPAGSVLQVCIGGSIGKAAITIKEVTFNQQINAIIPIIVEPQYLFYMMTAPYYIDFMKEHAGGTATPIINRGLWDNLLVPVAPVDEQKRIALKIEETFNKCSLL